MCFVVFDFWVGSNVFVLVCWVEFDEILLCDWCDCVFLCFCVFVGLVGVGCLDFFVSLGGYFEVFFCDDWYGWFFCDDFVSGDV